MLKWIKKVLDFGTDAPFITAPQRHAVRLINGICFFGLIAQVVESSFTTAISGADLILVLEDSFVMLVDLLVLYLNYRKRVKAARNIFTGLLMLILMVIPFIVPHSLNADGLYLVFVVIIFAVYEDIRAVLGFSAFIVALLLGWHLADSQGLLYPVSEAFGQDKALSMELVYTVMMVVLLLIALLAFRKSARDYQNELNSNLLEKDILIREVHHRVKNNLQMIVSMLGLQQDGAHTKEALEVINDVKARVVSMSMIHNKLYATNDFHEVELRDYIAELVDLLFDMHHGKATQLQKKVEVESFRTGLEFSIPLGLIITEVISNSLKHAFIPESAAVIEVTGHRRQDRFVLTLRDNGRGLVHKPVEGKGLGFLLIDILSNQIQAEVIRTNDNGLVTTISFNA